VANFNLLYLIFTFKLALILVLRLDLADALDPCLIEEAKLVLALDFLIEPLVETLPGWRTGNTQLAKQVFRCL